MTMVKGEGSSSGLETMCDSSWSDFYDSELDFYAFEEEEEEEEEEDERDCSQKEFERAVDISVPSASPRSGCSSTSTSPPLSTSALTPRPPPEVMLVQGRDIMAKTFVSLLKAGKIRRSCIQAHL